MKSLLVLPLLAACGGSTPEPTVEPAPEPAAEAPAPVAEPAPDAEPSAALAAALSHEARTDDDKARDTQRRPVATLAFFDVQPDSRVLELWPGGGWYSHILSPYLSAGGGHLVVTHYDTAAEPAYRGRHATAWKEYIDQYGVQDSTTTVVIEDSIPEFEGIEPVDTVLTFRNVHNWVAADIDADIYKHAFHILKPGGTFGVVEHRAAPGTTREQSADSGYMDQQAVIDAITAVGFEFVESSEINANPLDTKDHPEGVWTLPPSFALDDVDRDKYAAIGESDRMTLKFRRPAE